MIRPSKQQWETAFAVARARPWRVGVVGALVVMAGLGFGRFSYTMLLPATRQGLGLSYTAAGALATANLLGYLFGSLVSDTVSRRIGLHSTIGGGLLLLALSLGWMGAATGFVDAATARSLAGIAGAIVYVQALGLVPMWFPGRTRGLASGIMHSGNGAGLVLTGLGLPLVLETVRGHGWRAGWIALGLATFAILPLGWLYCRPPSGEGGTTHPLARSDAARTRFAEPVRRMSLAAYGGLYGLFGLSYIVYVTFFAEALRNRGLPLSQTGLIWALVGTLSLASGPIWGILSDRIGRLAGLAAAFGVQSIAYLAFLAPTAWSWTVSSVLFGVTAWGIPAIMAAAMGDIGHAGEAAAAFGRVTTVMGIGQAVGPIVAGVVADITGIPSGGLWVSVGAAITGGLWSFSARRAHRPS